MEMTYPAAGEIADYEPSDNIALEGTSPIITNLREVAQTLARTTLPVIIVGEAGSGTKALAHAIHRQSPQADDPFTVIACDAVSPSLFKPSTQPTDESPFARPGTVVLDGICDLSGEAQAALLKLLREADGATPARLLLCTDRELHDEVRRGRFREDLARYLGQVFVRMPALRQRREDIGHLAACMADKYAAMFGRPKPVLTPQLTKVLEDSPWPGNIRDLDAAMKMVVLVGDERVSIAALRSAGKEEKGSHLGIPLKEAARAASRAAEREVIQKVLWRSGGNRKLAARQLQISYKALLYKLKQFGLSSTPNREHV